MRAVEECYRGRQVRVFRLNRDAVLERLEACARTLVDERPEVLQVRLFGSLARGTAGPGSDADILIVLRDSTRPFLDRIADYARYLTGAGLGCDLFPYTVAELERLRHEGRGFAETAWTTSRLLAARVEDAIDVQQLEALRKERSGEESR